MATGGAAKRLKPADDVSDLQIPTLTVVGVGWGEFAELSTSRSVSERNDHPEGRRLKSTPAQPLTFSLALAEARRISLTLIT